MIGLLQVVDRPHALTGTEELALAARAGVGVVLALVAAVVIGVVVRRAGRRSPVVTDLSRRVRRPLRVLLVVLVLACGFLVWPTLGLCGCASPAPRQRVGSPVGSLKPILITSSLVSGPIVAVANGSTTMSGRSCSPDG